MSTSNKDTNRILAAINNLEKLLQKTLADRHRNTSIENVIINTVIKVTGITTQGLMEGRNREQSDIRKIAMATLYAHGYGYSHIGRIFNKHHTTVMYAIDQHQSIYQIYDEYKNVTDNIHNKLSLIINQPR